MGYYISNNIQPLKHFVFILTFFIGEKMKKESLSTYRRILIIDKLIASGSYPNVKTFMEKCEVSEATINRILDALRRDFGAEDILMYDRLKKGFYYNRPSFRIPAMLTSEKQIIAAKQISNLLNLIKGTT